MCVVSQRCLTLSALYLTFLLIASRLNVASAQNSTSQPRGSVPNFLCPSGFHCFNNTVRTVTIDWGHNGHICDGQFEEECYGEKDPFGFVRGPRQQPQTVVQGDKVIFKPSEMITFRVRNVTKNAYDNCILNTGQLVNNATSTSFEVPSKFLNPVGVKYFIDDNPSLFSCNFGIKLEMYVRSRQQPYCINSAMPQSGVCSGMGLCASNASKFFTRNYTCLCPNSYLGNYCEELDSCHSSRNPCKNGATCRDITDGLADSFNCTCLPGYTGNLCDTNINECASQPCQNKGFCVDYINRYTCLCEPDTEGVNCETVIFNMCSLQPCKNGGTCERSGEKRQNYTCTCPPSFTGRNCTVNITSSSIPFSSMTPFQTSMLLSTTLVVNSSSVRQGVSSSFSFTSTVLTSLLVYRSLTQTIASTPELASSAPLQSRKTSSASLSSQQSLLPTINTSLLLVSTSPVELSSTSLTKFSSSSTINTSHLSASTSPVEALSSSLTKFSSSSTIDTSLLSVSTPPVEASSSSLIKFSSSSIINTSLLSVATPPVEASSSSLIKFSSSSTINTSLLSVATSPVEASSSSLTTFSSLVKVVSSSATPFSSSPLVPSSTQVVFESSSASASQNRSLNVVSGTTSVLFSLSSSASSTIKSSSSSQAISPSLPTSIYSSVTPAASPAAMSTVIQSSSKLFSRLPFSSAAITTSKISTGTLPTFLASSATVLSKSTSSVTTTVPLSTTVFYTSTMTLSPSRSTVIVLSSVWPTSSPSPTLPPLSNQTCLHNPCINNGTCYDEPYSGHKFRCECPYPTLGPRCKSIQENGDLHFPGFRQGSFLEHKSISFNNELNTIDVTFQTNATEGLILFAADHKERGDFIQLSVVGGKLEFRFDPGDSLVFIRSDQNVNTGETITATATYVTRADPPFGTLQIGNGTQLKGEVKGKLKGIQLYDSWYVGGVPLGFSMLNKTKGNAAPVPSFVGAIKDVQVNKEAINLADATNWFNINEGDMPPCERMPCQNNGVCIPDEDNVHAYSCNCTKGYTGENCETHSACESENCNGGECIAKDSNPKEFICLCPLGRVGVQCETVISISVPLFTIVQSFPSFLEYPVPKDAVRSFHVTFLFRVDDSSPSWNDSLLVYSAQNKFEGSGDDFFAIGLKNNMVLLQYNLGSGIARISSEPLNTAKDWHLVVAGRDDRDGYLYVDDQSRKEGRSVGPLVGLNLFEPLYIGGVPDIRQLPSVLDFKSGGFHGAIYDVAIKFSLKTPFIQLSTQGASNAWAVVRGRNVGNESYDECTVPSNTPCMNGGNCTREGATFLCSCPQDWAGLYCNTQLIPCYSYNPCVTGTCRPDGSTIKCDCPLGKTGQYCDQDITIQTPLFQNFSYMMFTKINVRSSTQISIRFKPAVRNGILFYVAHDEQSITGDFLSIYLHHGFVKLRYDLGKGVGEAKSNSTVILDMWHSVTVSRNAKNASLSLDGNPPVSVVSPGTAVALDVNSNFFLGGVRKLSTVNPNAVDNDPASIQDFSGCINQLEVNGILYFQSNTRALEGRNIANCPPESAA